MEIYIHIPFCRKKCGYCDFLSAPAGEETIGRYVEALRREIRSAGFAQGQAGTSVRTVYLGGGTPSLLSPPQIEGILEEVFRCFPVERDAEISMEANPGTVSGEALARIRRAGVNRLSLGVQSTDDRELKMLGRIHTFADARQSLSTARKAGFDNINLDLMFALPGQTVQSWEKTLRTAAGLFPDHISAYGLMIEEGTPFSRMKPDLPGEDDWREMYEAAAGLLAGYGFHRYEISNYAKPGRECRHNIGYWTRVPYLGFGIGAASLWEHQRFCNTRSLERYLVHSADPDGIREEITDLSEEDEMAETMFLGLRMQAGVSEAAFEKTFRRKLRKVYAAPVRKHLSLGMLQETDGRLALTEQGFAVSNAVMADFL